ncbi:MAG: hypothetical protein LC624_01115 [Halobacteriales archaeon]|nr:hypothetical protein [Halobacteriales archaeon]
MRLALALGALALTSLAGSAVADDTPYTNCVTPSYPLLLGYGYSVVCVLDDGPVYQGDPVGPGSAQQYSNLLYYHGVMSSPAGFGVDEARLGQDSATWSDGATSGTSRGTTGEGTFVLYSLATGQGTTNTFHQQHDQAQTCDEFNTCRSTDSQSTTFDGVTFISARDGPSDGIGVHYASSEAGQGCHEEMWVDQEQDGQVTRTDVFPEQQCILAHGVPQVADKFPFPDWPDLPPL